MKMARKNGCVFPADEGGNGGGSSLDKNPTGFWRWMVIDASGQEKILEADKYSIIRRMQIHARDFRILDPLLSYPSTILVRERVIVLNLEVFFRAPFDENVAPVVEELRRRIQSERAIADKRESSTLHEREIAEEDDSPFEFKALEVALEAVCSHLNARSTELEAAVYPALDMLTSKISSRNLERLRKLKSQMTRLTARVQKVRDEIEQLLDDDDDMADLYLSRRIVSEIPEMSGSSAVNQSIYSLSVEPKISRASRISLASSYGDENDAEEVEMLLEAYFIQIDGTLDKLATLREYIDSTEDYINIQLDSHRNQLIQLDFFLSTGTVSLTIFALVTGIFGMNIPYTWKTGHGYLFKWVILLTGTFCVFLFMSVVSYARYKGLVGSS
ncbi:OLC1v1019861C2 [Oldenlandia corymbosa var. corymbosa]|uniref:Magnesium transporter n=1 Tax=Oldenlandia corymbosa var. corymbosa TaxID=529605 RepID=A0AAV1EEX8_OLDCO|nr:OLC1v1019861C2 [Oldenlandia corymbosa var. corymbosa]